MDGDSVRAESMEVNFENLHGNMILENNNEEPKTTEKISGKKMEEKDIKTNNATENAVNAVEEAAENTLHEIDEGSLVPKTQDSEEMATHGDQNEDIQSIAKEIIDEVVNNAAELVKNSMDDSKADDETGENRSKPNKSDQDEWLDILGSGLLKKKVLVAGGGVDTRPKRDQEVTIKYESRLKDGTIVESEDNFVFILSDHDVVGAIDFSVSLMEKGEKSIITSDAKYAYGEEGKPPKIPPNSDLTYEIEVLDVQEGPHNVETDLQKRLAWADKKRERGNMFYSQKDYEQSTYAYTRCTRVLEKAWLNEESDEKRRAINALRLKCYNNLAVSQMKQEKWKDALKACRAAEKLEPENVKALFRKGKVHVMLGELDKGTQVLTKASRLEPDNKIVAAELAKQKRRLEQQKEAQKKMYRRMMGTKDEKVQPEQKSLWAPGWSRVFAGTLALGAVLVGIYITQRG